MKKRCLECTDEFIGRADKKFCCDGCRSSYNNKLNSDTTNFVRNINNILRKNRRILAELNPNGKSKTHKDKLLEKINLKKNKPESVSDKILHYFILRNILKSI